MPSLRRDLLKRELGPARAIAIINAQCRGRSFGRAFEYWERRLERGLEILEPGPNLIVRIKPDVKCEVVPVANLLTGG